MRAGGSNRVDFSVSNNYVVLMAQTVTIVDGGDGVFVYDNYVIYSNLVAVVMVVIVDVTLTFIVTIAVRVSNKIVFTIKVDI